MKIGYMGLPGSYTEAAARQLIKSQGLSDAELVPLISAAAVRRSLDTSAVSKGVIAVADQAGRPVSETAQVFPKDSYTPEAELTLPVHYCLFRRSTVADFDIREVASHLFALKQTEEFIALHYPYWADVDTPDTAQAAQMLSDGELSITTAVICSKAAGEANGLVCIASDIEDQPNHAVTFCLIKG
ncbi:hypothetical protein CXIVA_19760 [Clostridium sp. SY8519]|uniref:prephenate dehydratase domain-containing protein n=1 Tax=Clostridium sp. (strain SY8519) TaxID=1042156 RepID=UPI0002172104|nr:prephenate dehydratase domain-containing protein [Clostridium sp. SY8519]BAK47943.1 hypothetical protein CXIVA_19760 [Clostridium sp. SY8519]